MLDEPDFLFAPPALEFLFACNCLVNAAEGFEVNEAKNSIARCESGNKALAVFDHSVNEVAGHAGVEVSGATGEDLNEVLAFHGEALRSRSLTPVRKRRDRVRDDKDAGGARGKESPRCARDDKGSWAETLVKGEYLQAFDAAVVDYLYGDAFVFAQFEGQGDGAAIVFDEVGIDFSFEVAC